MKWMVYFLSVFLSGCSFSAGFKPPPDAYMLWTKPGATLLDVKKTLMECGKPSPSPSGSGPDVAHMSQNDKALSNLCMIQAGFAYKLKGGYCKNDPSLPACQPGAKIPKPSRDRRLNSHYCKIVRDHDYCLAHSHDPSLCTHDDDLILYPECF